MRGMKSGMKSGGARLGAMSAAGLVMIAGAAAGADDAVEPIVFEERPGVQEFTGELIVKPLPTADLAAEGLTGAQAQARRDLGDELLDGYRVVGRIDLVDEPALVIEVPAGRTEGDVATELMASGAFEYVHPNWRVFIVDCPDDTFFADQWHHDEDHLDSCAGWDIFTGDPGVSVAICDTGVDIGHGDLDGNRVEGFNSTTGLFESEGGVITPSGAHGTYVAGCAAGQGNDGFGITGVGQDLSYRPVRVSENGNNSSLDRLVGGALAGVGAGDRVANVSFSGVDNPVVVDAATSIKQMGGLLVWSAGNDGRTLTFGDRDADDLIVVGATAQGDSLTGFSARGPFVDLVAPGQDVLTAAPNTSFSAVDGTSFSAPLAAGLAALIFSVDPSLTPDEVEQILKGGTDDLGAAGIDNTFGYGRINVFGSLDQVDFALVVDLVDGLPDAIDPSGGSSFMISAQDGSSSVEPGSGVLVFDDGTGQQQVPLNDLGGGMFEAVFPATSCPSDVEFFVSFDATSGERVTLPRLADSGVFFELPAASDLSVELQDDFETDQGWTVTNSPGLTAGAWERGLPQDNGRGDPSADFDGSGQAYLTEINQVTANSDVDGGSTTLISPVFDLSDSAGAILRYARWFDNSFGGNPGQDPWIVQITDDGVTWTDLENTVNGAGGWSQQEFAVQDFVSMTDRVQVRFIASDDSLGSVVEAGVDAFEMIALSCSADCPADLSGPGGNGQPDGVVDAEDFFFYLGLFASGDQGADLTGPGGDGAPDGVIDAEDFFFYLSLFSAGCP